MKYIYLVENRELNNSTQQFELRRTEAYSSKIKAVRGVNNSMECNEAYDIEEGDTILDETVRSVDYSTMGFGGNDTRVEMRIRTIIDKVELK